jgi:putative endopeptidase
MRVTRSVAVLVLLPVVAVLIPWLVAPLAELTKTCSIMATDAAFTPPSPADDYNMYVNGAWISTNKIPDDQTRWGSFMILNEENLARCRAICEERADSLIGQLYAKMMTPASAIDPTFASFINEIHSRVADASSYFAVAARMLTAYGQSATFHICKSEDSKNPELRVPHLTQKGLGLPDKSYYTDRKDVHAAYATYITELCAIFGVPDVDGNAVLAFEARLAEKHLDRDKRRDPDVVYNKREWRQLAMGTFFDSLDLADKALSDMTYAIVDNPALLEHIASVVADTDVATLRAHLIFSFADHVAPYATSAAQERRFEFRGRVLSGQKSNDPLWKRSVRVVESLLGDELGKEYVARHFPGSKREECSSMVGDLRTALKETLEALDWMAPATKEHALLKLSRFGVKIGVPTQWHSIEGLWDGVDVKTASLGELLAKWFEWDWRYQEVAKFYTPPERELWHMTPQTVNAYYHPEMNEIVFPAGILQKPFFGFETYEENLGAIGVVIGHEMTHGFDDQGRKYNALGELKDWWTQEDAKEFDIRAATVRDHFGSIQVQGKNVNGQLTLGENIADIGGIKLALRALRIHYGGDDKVSEDILKRFFTAYAGIWRMIVRPETELKLLAIDPHSPCHLRINAALGHIAEFAKVYGVKEGNGMYLPPNKRMSIW